jgi:hypothetical protein
MDVTGVPVGRSARLEVSPRANLDDFATVEEIPEGGSVRLRDGARRPASASVRRGDGRRVRRQRLDFRERGHSASRTATVAAKMAEVRITRRSLGG